LENLPKGLKSYDSAYEEAMKRIKGHIADSRELAKQVLSWITFAKRLLTTLELQHALAVEIGESRLDEENIPDVVDVVSVCAGLVIVDEECNIVRLAHYTVQQYLERTQNIWFPDAQNYIAMTCVAYLSFDAFQTGFSQTDEEFEARLRVHVLYGYAARNWGHHVRATLTEVQPLILNLLECEAKVSALSQAMLAFGQYPH
jgi:hypothetical protein